MRNKFAEISYDLVSKDEKAVILLGDISHFLLRKAQEVAPNRVHNIGICEQAMVSVAVGMALEGMKPIIHTIAPFVVERAYEQIKVGIGYQNTNVTIITVGGTYDYSDLGCTHHCYSDIALMRLIPNMMVFEPGSPLEFEQLFKQSWNVDKPKYFRLSANSHTQTFDVRPEYVNIIRQSNNNKYIFVSGHLLDDVLKLDDYGIVYVSTLSSISESDIALLLSILSKDTELFAVENHFTIGGLGDLISSTFNLPVKRIGLNNKFITEYGSFEDLRVEAEMDTDSIIKKITL